MCRAVSWVLFFQAEDGIRDLVRSRGLGDVYKRQPLAQLEARVKRVLDDAPRRRYIFNLGHGLTPEIPVSYTHLTLPTSDLV